jgi:hypothetical protein
LSTDTPDLIEKLSRDLKPVPPLPRAALRAGLFALAALALGFTVLLFTHAPRPDLAVTLYQPVYIVQGFAMFMAGLLAGFAAFRLSVPDTKVRTPVKAALAAASGAWLVLIVSELLQAGFAMPPPAESCLIGLTLAMAAPLVLGIVMVIRSAPVWRGWAGYALVLSVGSFAALAMRFICPNDSPAHLLVWHFLPVAIFAALGIFLGKILLKKNIAKK